MGLCSSSEQDLHTMAKMSTGAATGRNNSLGAESGAAAAAMMLGSNSMSARVELFISCQGLRNLDSTSKSDPFCILEEFQEANTNHARWVEVGRSEVCVNTLNPTFVTRFKYVYHFEQEQKLRVRVFDADGAARNTQQLQLSDQDFNGETAAVYLGDLVTSRRPAPKTKCLPLTGQTKHGPARGTCTIRVEELANQSGVVKWPWWWYPRAPRLQVRGGYEQSEPALAGSPRQPGGPVQ